MGALTSAYFWTEIVAPVLKIAALSVSLAGLILALGLILRGEATLRALRGMNRWVSTRRAMKAFEIPRSAEPRAPASRRGIGIVVAAVGAYAIVVLALQFDAGRLASVFGEHPRYSAAAIAIDAVRWMLVAGSAAAVAVGLMMLFTPRALASLESLGNRWVSSRQIVAGADSMRTPLDSLAERFPRAAGALLLVLSAAAAAASTLMLLSRP
jgi:hypothetical protein